MAGGRYELIQDGPRYESLEPAYKIGAEGLPDAMKQVAGETGTVTNLLAGAGAKAQNAYLRMKELFDRDMNTRGARYQFTPEEQQTIEDNRAITNSSTAGMIGGVLGDIGMTYPIGGPLYKGASTAASAVLPKILQWLAPSAGGATVGATTPMLTEPGAGANEAQSGGIGGAAADLAMRGAGRVVQPIMQSEPVRTLLQNKIVPTLGQAAGKVANSVEEKLSSYPLIGDIIKSSRQRAVKEEMGAMIRGAAPEVTQIGREGVAAAERSVGRGYDAALANVTVKADPSFTANLEAFGDNPALLLTPTQRSDFKKFIRDNVDDNIGASGTIDGEMAKKMDSLLGQKAVSLRSSSVTSEREMGRAFQDAQTEFRKAMEKGASDPATAAQLADLNKRWAQIVRLERATAASKEGIPTPGQYLSAVKAEDKSVRKSKFAKGEARGQDLAEAGYSVLGDKYPDSGTAGRLLLPALIAGGGVGAGVNEHFGGPQSLTALALAPLLYSRAGTRYLLGDLIPGQQAGSALLRRGAPYAAAGGGGLFGEPQ